MCQHAAVEAVAKEIRALSRSLINAFENPELFPSHVQRLHLIATKVRQDRASRGISQAVLDPNSLPLEKAQRVVYAVYDHRSPELFYLASRDPPGIDLHRMFLLSLRSRNNRFLDYLSRIDFSLLGIYPLESIAIKGVPFSVISKSRLSFWRSLNI
ncbi:hypothetical protein BgAZ_107030 [Babesia gibsoni]|uniref:Uncharacterized protein n=1 Tax=Babesia gibsoni TaxID=33632 RepID=A0AAD8PGA0_BABGI|nr:hypothetical protein BgAZ_107030 [Babesia gibsoni]